VIVKTPAGKKIPIEVMTDDTIASVKERIADKEGVGEGGEGRGKGGRRKEWEREGRRYGWRNE
jgi:hypothetical protein